MEAALLDPQLPPSVLADNKKVVAVMRQFVKNLEPPGGGYPPPFRHPRVTMVFRCAAAAWGCVCMQARCCILGRMPVGTAAPALLRDATGCYCLRVLQGFSDS